MGKDKVPKHYVNENIGNATIHSGKVRCNERQPNSYFFSVKDWELILNRYYEVVKTSLNHSEALQTENGVFYLDIRRGKIEIGCQDFWPSIIYFYSKWLNKNGAQINIPKITFLTKLNYWLLWKTD